MFLYIYPDDRYPNEEIVARRSNLEHKIGFRAEDYENELDFYIHPFPLLKSHACKDVT